MVWPLGLNTSFWSPKPVVRSPFCGSNLHSLVVQRPIPVLIVNEYIYIYIYNTYVYTHIVHKYQTTSH